MLTILSIHSRKGGVGKTSLGLTVAALLAAEGKKTAWVDLDTLGTHVSQIFPYRGVTATKTTDRKSIEFQSREKKDGMELEYRLRPYLCWWLIGEKRPTQRRKPLECGEKFLVPGSANDLAKRQKALDRVRAMADKLTLFPMSCWVQDINAMNLMLVTTQAQSGVRSFMTGIITELADNGTEYVVIDNSPGLSFGGGVIIDWALQIAQGRPNEFRVHLMLQTTENWSEQGLLLYEINVYRERLPAANPIVIVNRVQENNWLGSYPTGKLTTVSSDNVSALPELISTCFHLPIWMSADLDADSNLNRWLIPLRLSIAPLGHDPKMMEAFSTAYEFSEERKSMNASTEPGSSRWGRRAEHVFNGLILPACLPKLSGFQKDVYSSLVEPLLPAEVRAKP
jgi:hypothetical protein